jgi:sigma-B regulation protein RsbU (phosphoserine phosphatase)
MAAVMSAAGIHASAADTPDLTLEALRDSLSAKLAAAESYLTVFYGIFDPSNRRLTWASAGHPHAFRVPRNGRPERLAATAPPLGLGSGPVGVLTMPWHPADDLLCLWTDGLVDAANAAGERFGEARLLAALGARRDCPPEQIVAQVMAEADSFAPHPADDRTLLVLRL